MKQKKNSDPQTPSPETEAGGTGDRMEDEFRAFEELISPEANVEYEEDAALQTLKHANRFEERPRMTSGGIEVPHIRDGEEHQISIPLHVRFPEGGSAEYILDVSFTLQKVKTSGNTTFPDGEPPGLSSEGDPGLEIDILDGRTSLLFGEDEEPEDEAEGIAEEAEQTGWIAKLFSFWRRKT